jgi:hypothetical protein
MRRRKAILVAAAGAAVAFVAVGTAVAAGPFNFGVFRDDQLAHHSTGLFGVQKPLATSSSAQITHAEALADPTKLATLAKGLHARVVTTDGPPVYDQISLWPNDVHPTHLIVCNEEGTTAPGLVRIDLGTGAATTIVTGTTSCDPTRRTRGARSCSVRRPARVGVCTS